MGPYVLFAFNGEAVCFLHVLLNALDLASEGATVSVVIEGAATGLLPAYAEGAGTGQHLFDKALAGGLVDCACRACAEKMGGTAAAEKLGILLKGEMAGHPAMSEYLAAGYTVITF